MGLAFAALMGGLGATACGSDGPGVGLSGSSGDSGTGAADGTGGDAATGGGAGSGAAAGGPTGMLGADVGDTMPSLEWVGYVNESAEGAANLQPIVDYSVDALGATGAPFALVHFGAVF